MSKESSQSDLLLKYDGNLYALEIFQDKLYTGGKDNTPLGKENGVINVYNFQSCSWNTILTKEKGNIKALLGFKDKLFASILNGDTYSIEEFNSQGDHCASYPTTKDAFCLIIWRGYLVSAGENICIWDIEERSIKYTWKAPDRVYSLCVWNSMLCSGHYDGTISLWNSNGEEMMKLQGHTNTV